MSIFSSIKQKILLLLALGPTFLITNAIATIQTGIAAGGSATMSGSLGLLIDLGIENIPGVTLPQAKLYYNWISFALVIWIAFNTDERSSTVFCVIATGMAAFCAAVGWFTTPNPVGQWGLIVMCALLSVIMYMTEKKRIVFGGAGGGDPLMNIVVFLLILQSTVGLINGAGIFQAGQTIATPSDCAGGVYTSCAINGNVQLASLQQNTGTGNIISTGFSILNTVVTAGWSLIILVIQLAVSIVAFSYVIYTIYPWVLASPQAILVIGVLQVGIWIIYMFALSRYIWKPMPGDVRL